MTLIWALTAIWMIKCILAKFIIDISISVVSERTLSLEEVTNDTLRDDFNWPMLLGDQNQGNWDMSRTQELITDLTHSGDPSTYLTTPTSNDLTTSTVTYLSHPTTGIDVSQASTYLTTSTSGDLSVPTSNYLSPASSGGMITPTSNYLSPDNTSNHMNVNGLMPVTSGYDQFNTNTNQTQQYHQLPSIDSIHQRSNSNQLIFQSLELSPSPDKLDEELFATPEYSESSNDGGEDFPTLDLNNGISQSLQPVSSANNPNWTQFSNEDGTSVMNLLDQIENSAPNHNKLQNQSDHPSQTVDDNLLQSVANEGQQTIILPSMSTFRVTEEPLMGLTPLEPVSTSVIVQDAHAHCWGDDYPWDESKTLSMLDANLDFENLIGLDA